MRFGLFIYGAGIAAIAASLVQVGFAPSVWDRVCYIGLMIWGAHEIARASK
jgi:hypothetical protein